MFCLYRISGQPSLCCGIQWWSTQARMTPHCAGKNCTELTIKIYVDARPVKDRTKTWAEVVVVVFVLIIISPAWWLVTRDYVEHWLEQLISNHYRPAQLSHGKKLAEQLKSSRLIWKGLLCSFVCLLWLGTGAVPCTCYTNNQYIQYILSIYTIYTTYNILQSPQPGPGSL